MVFGDGESNGVV